MKLGFQEISKRYTEVEIPFRRGLWTWNLDRWWWWWWWWWWWYCFGIHTFWINFTVNWNHQICGLCRPHTLLWMLGGCYEHSSET